MLPHGPDRDAFEGVSNADLQSEKLDNTMSFMFETRFPQHLTPFAADEAPLQDNYIDCSATRPSHHKRVPDARGRLAWIGYDFGSGKGNCGSLLELSWGGTEPFTLDTGETRSFIEDGDRLSLKGVALGDGYRIGFGPCVGRLLPARKT